MNKSSFILNQSTPRSRSRRRVILLIVSIVLLLLAVGLLLVFYNPKNDPVDSSAEDPTITSAKDTPSTTGSAKTNSGQGGVTTSDQVPENSQISVGELTFQQNNGIVSASSVVNSSSTGDCVFSFTTTDGRPVVKQTVSTATADYQSCNITIPEVEFDKIGVWEMNVTFYMDGSKSSAVKNVEIR